MRIKRAVAVFLALITLLALAAVSISAATPTYDVSARYKNSKYYQNFKKIPISGDQATDVVAIALSQLGYHEGNSNSDLSGENAKGTRDFVEYNVLYGKVDNNQGNGLSYGYSWCASFVNWCLRQAGVSVADSAAAEISCRRWLQKCKDAGIYLSKDQCTPEAGDMIFFKDADSKVASTHIGIVLYSTDKKVYTVEGNTADGDVSIESYSLKSSYIVGYGRPNYVKNDQVAEVDYSGENMSAGLYISKASIEVYHDRKMSEGAKTLPAKEVFTVKEIFADSFRVEYDVDGETVEGYASIEKKSVQLTALSSLRKVDFLDSEGGKIFRTQYFLPTTEIKIPDVVPEKEGARFVCWVPYDDPEKSSSTPPYYPGDVIESQEKDIVFLPLWDTNHYKVIYKDETGKIISEFSGFYGDTYEIPKPESVPKEKKFVRWECQTEFEDNELFKAEPGIIKNNAIYVAVLDEKPFVDILAEYSRQIVGIGLAVIFIGLGFFALITLYRKKP